MSRWTPGLHAVRALTRDGQLLFASRFCRLFGFGMLSVILVLYLAELGLTAAQIGILLAGALCGDMVVSLGLTVRADRVGRRRMLLAGAWLIVLAAIALVASREFVVLLAAVTLGVVSPSGNEVGPFLSLEQAALAELSPAEQRTDLFVWYNLVGAFATGAGALIGGAAVSLMEAAGYSGAVAYWPVVAGYGCLGIVLAGISTRLSPAVEAHGGTAPAAATPVAAIVGLHASRTIVLRLSALFAVDSFAGGLVIQSIVAWWLHQKFGVSAASLGQLFLATNVLAGLSYLAAGWLARRIGLLNTMVFTHLPSNILLILVPLMPGFATTALLLLMRAAISQMDVPTRQAYLMAVVTPLERSAAAGVTAVARSLGAAASPPVATALLATPGLTMLLFGIAGGLKVLYDLLLFRAFRHRRPDHERVR
jgi:MFS family permease